MATLDQVISSLPADSGPKGKAWERLCRWFLLHDPVYASQLRRVWLWDEWPERWGADNGIDLVAEAHDGALWAIQAKAYAKTTTVTKADVDSFLSESNREQISFRLLIATTDSVGTNARKVMVGQEKPASLLMLSDLRTRPLDWPDGGEFPPPRAPYTPRPHQQEALEAIRTVETGERGRVIMACGTGKTLVQLWAHEQLQSHRTLVLVPSLFLVAQVMQEWTANRVRPFEFLAVCSDETVLAKQEDRFVANVSEIGVPVTTDPGRIAHFLNGAGDRVIFSTYQSSARIAEALSGTDIRFDLVLADEAHQLAGNPARDFAAVLDDTRIPADRRLFFTATPRYYTGKSTGSDGESDLEVASMDDETLFGPEVHRLSFGEAIRRDLLSDYQVVVVGITDRQAYELATEGSFVEFAGNKTDARSLARQIGLAKAMHDYQLQRVISFHNRVKMAQQFAASLPAVISRLPAARAPQGRMVFDYVSGEMATGDRRNKLNRLRNIDADEYALLANARCLSEGVDVPSIDGVAFIDPRRSQIDIVQAVGRAIRTTEDKKLGTIVIPVFVPEGETNEAILADSAFEPVWAVVRALRDHDEVLADQLDAARRTKGHEGRITRAALPPKIVLDLSVDLPDGFMDAIVTRIVERASSSWEESFAHLEQYVEQHRDARVPQIFKTEDGYNLGTWVATQRHTHSRLAAERIARLEAVSGWVWEPLEAAWEEGFARLQEYVSAHGDARVTTVFKTEDGYRLGGWVNNQRVNYSKMAPERFARLEALSGWVWEPLEAAWEEGFARLQEYVSAHGDARVPQGLKTEYGYNLGTWVTGQRSKRSRLAAERIARLEAVSGWVWDSHEAMWEEGFAHVEGYVAAHGDARVPQRFKTEDGYNLGAWVAKQRGTRNTMAAERVDRLEALSGWVWDAREAMWEEGFARLEQYVEQHGDARVPDAFTTDDGYNLGMWISGQRRNRVTLAAERVARLEALGFVWEIRQRRDEPSR